MTAEAIVEEVTVEEVPRVDVPEGEVQADPATSQSGGGPVIQADILPTVFGTAGKYFLTQITQTGNSAVGTRIDGGT